MSLHYWFSSVLSDFTCEHLRWCSLWKYLLLMLYSIGQWCCTHIYFLWISCFLCHFICRVHLLAGSFTLFQVVPCSSTFIDGSSSLFQLVPAGSRWFQLIRGGSSSFQRDPRFSMYALKIHLKSQQMEIWHCYHTTVLLWGVWA